MNKELWFPTPIWYDNLEFNREEILSYVCELRKRDPIGRKLSNYGGWQSNDLIIESSNILVNFFDIVFKKCEFTFKEIGSNFKVVMDNAWINISGPNDFNKYHYHPNSTLSGVVYLNVDEDSGDLVFYSPTHQQHYPFFNYDDHPFFYKHVVYKPKNNMIILFPSWIAHEVLPSPLSKVERVSIAFNFRQQKV